VNGRSKSSPLPKALDLVQDAVVTALSSKSGRGHESEALVASERSCADITHELRDGK
jgi:hypothetical protein